MEENPQTIRRLTQPDGQGIGCPRALLVATATLLLCATPGAAQSPIAFTVRADATPCLRVRAGPTSTSAIVACLAPGTPVEATGVTAYWREIRFGGVGTGWAAKRWLVVADSAAVATTDSAAAWLEIHVVDVGQGDGIWIHTFDDNVPGNGRYEGENIVIDGGPDASDSRNAFLKYVLARAHEGARIDALFITHPHDDHYPGAEGILRHFEVASFYDSGYPKAGAKWAQFLALVGQETAGGKPIEQHVGRSQFGTIDWGSELKVDVLYAYPGTPDGLGTGNTLENNASIVLRIQYGSQSMLLMGDAEGKNREDAPDVPKYAERIILGSAAAPLLHSTVLKIAHHGSETSSTTPFIAAVDPAYVIVSSGRKSFNGRFLPDSTTLRRYCAHNPAIRIYRTDEGDAAEGRTTADDADGDDVIIRMSPTTTEVEAHSNGTRITHTTCGA